MGSRLEKLQELEEQLYTAMQEADTRSLPALARQYRETIREIDEIQGASDRNDEISEILSEREATGQARTVR